MIRVEYTLIKSIQALGSISNSNNVCVYPKKLYPYSYNSDKRIPFIKNEQGRNNPCKLNELLIIGVKISSIIRYFRQTKNSPIIAYFAGF